MKPHRGMLILILGILGAVCCLPCGIAAWIMGSRDLKEMDAGKMDPGGRQQTYAGRVIGMIATLLFAVMLVLVIAGLLIAVFLRLSFSRTTKERMAEERAAAAHWAQMERTTAIAGKADAKPKSEEERKAQMMQDANAVVKACMLYALEHQDMLPARLTDLAPYLEPSFDLSGYTLEQQGKMSEIKDPAKTPLVRKKLTAFAPESAVGYADGHAEIITDYNLTNRPW
ncbi:MAG: DUF4190 domain-containing protein [Candidatus Sumerlaeota bacterium]|nr:DUF4190 domain-containing protein [Candidatus Sumerlaeota bacterium]